MSQKFGNAKMYSLKDKLAEEAKEEAERLAREAKLAKSADLEEPVRVKRSSKQPKAKLGASRKRK